jgi:hypothetical protein
VPIPRPGIGGKGLPIGLANPGTVCGGVGGTGGGGTGSGVGGTGSGVGCGGDGNVEETVTPTGASGPAAGDTILSQYPH